MQSVFDDVFIQQRKLVAQVQVAACNFVSTKIFFSVNREIYMAVATHM